MDRTPRRLLPRFLGSLAVAALVLGLLLLAAVATASGRGEFTFAQPHAGDRWTYDLELGDGWTFGANDTVHEGLNEDAFGFAWQSPVQVRLPDGRLHDAAQLDVNGVIYDPPAFEGRFGDDGHHWADYMRSEWMGRDGLMAIKVGGGAGYAGGGGGFAPLGMPTLQSSQSVSSVALVTDFEPEEGLCLAEVPVAGHTVSLEGRIHVSPPCHLGGMLDVRGEQWLRAGPVETVAGVQALRFDGQGVSFWFSPSIPYPIQVRTEATADVPAVTLRMSGFTAGTRPLLVPDEPSDPLPPLQLLAPTTWGPDDVDSGIDFPLSEAFQRAREAPEFPALRDFLARNPDAFATDGMLQIEDQEHAWGPMNESVGQARTWSMSLSSETDCFWFQATRQVSRPEAVPGLGPLPVQPPGEGPETTYDFDTHDFDCPEARYGDGTPKPTPPKAWPSVASALVWWEAFASPEEREQGPTGWSFFMHYDDDSGRWVQDMAVGQEAGRSLRTTTLDSMQFTGIWGGDGGSLDLEGGRVVAYSRVINDFRSERPLGSLPSPGSAVGPDAGSDDSVVQSPPSLGQLGPVEATGIGVAAALAGLLYLLWPWLKGSAAFAGLFSRLQGPELLEHPVRRELVQRIEAHPGIHYQDLVRAMGKGKGAIEHHLRKLQEAGLVKALAAGGYTCWFPTKYDHRLVGAAPALKSDGARAVLAAVQAHPGTSARAVGLATGLSPAAVNHHLQRLAGAGLVSIVRAGRSLSILPTDLAGQVGSGSAAGAA